MFLVGSCYYEDKACDNIINKVMADKRNVNTDIKWAIYYELEGFGDPSTNKLISDVQYVNNKYFDSSYYFKIDNKPVLFVYGDGNDQADMVNRWKVLKEGIPDVYVVLKLFAGYELLSGSVDGWHQYAPANRYEEHFPYSAYISPGFWFQKDTDARLSRDLNEFETAVQSLQSSGSQFKLI